MKTLVTLISAVMLATGCALTRTAPSTLEGRGFILCLVVPMADKDPFIDCREGATPSPCYAEINADGQLEVSCLLLETELSAPLADPGL